MQIFPAIDIFNGRCVRLTEGLFSQQKNYDVSPRDMAEQFAAAGAKQLHVVDLEGAKEGHVVNWDALTQVLAVQGISVQVGGGIRTEDDVQRLLNLGAKRVVVGSLAARSPETLSEWAKKFGPESFCAALDLKDGKIATNGWQDSEEFSLAKFVASMANIGVVRILSTDIRRDGLLAGPNISLYRELVTGFPSMEWIASGGVRSKEDIVELATTGVEGAIIGKAIYEKAIPLDELFRTVC
ncbi:MAG TPA: 1-(5-phosphoribosyl)-5-[(5-phosphoribosylamino)methylideneamino]imidazole-4-carboxamide isomerase [Bacteroidota bacterium]|nr:1-(5-phosphoribosyl)-5-[(5-phosphoribosylamino)methylideneamino]imidazole-4-carboxamide isomerase [Bacteroidota bacterium]